MARVSVNAFNEAYDAGKPDSRPPDLDYDVVIIGAGPAGCMAAIRAPSRLRVLLVDRLDMPRDVICGGVLMPSVLEMISDISTPPDDIFSLPKKINWSLCDWRLNRFGPLTDTAYYNIERSRFDAWLYETAAERSNVDLLPLTTFLSVSENADGGLAVTLKRNSETIHVASDFLIGADGAKSNVRRFTGAPDTQCWTTVQQNISRRGANVDRFIAFLGNEIDYYGWVVPKGEEIVVGLGCYGGENDPRNDFITFRELLQERYGIYGEDSGRLRSRPATRLRSFRELYPGRGRILLAGEAAGLICPWSGEGISSAVFSGTTAGSLLVHHSPIKKYRRVLYRQIPRRIFNQIGFQTITRPWACRLMALAVPGSDFRLMRDS